MNKQTLIILSIVLAAIPSCGKLDDMIEVTMEDRLTPDTYFRNEEQLQLYSNAFYSYLVPGGTGVYQEAGDATITSPLDEKVSGQREVPESGGSWNWTALRKINFFLTYIDNCPDKAAVRKYEAIARVFRAWFYFEKVKRFGDVPWYDKVLESNDPDLYKPRDSREVVMTHVMADLDAAIEVLARQGRTKDPYRITWWSAQALKSRIALFEGTFRKYHGIDGWESYLQACETASSAILKATGGYSLYSAGAAPYRDMFANVNFNTSSYSREIILGRDYDQGQSVSHNLFAYLNTPGLGRPGLTRRFINTYLNEDGTRFTDRPGWQTMEFKDEIKGRDPRLTQTIRTTSGLNMNTCQTGYQFKKFVPDSYMASTASCYVDLPAIRLAEVMLNYAEAKAELGTLDQADLDLTVNRLRARAKVTGTLSLATANADPDPYLSAPETGYIHVIGPNKGVILEIRRERAIELVMEGFRYFDLVRWKEGRCMDQEFQGIYVPEGALGKPYDMNGDGIPDVCFYTGTQPSAGNVSYIQISTDGTGAVLSEGTYGRLVLFGWIERHWNEDRDYYYPIPREDITLTGGALKQNPGWN